MLGAEQVILSLCSNSRAYGYEPSIAVIRDVADPEPELLACASSRGIPAISINSRNRFDPRAVAQLRRLIEVLGADILHCHGYREDLYGLLGHAGARLVATNHLWKRTTAALRFYAKVDSYLMRRFDSVVAVSHDILEEMRCLGMHDSKLAYIPNGVDLDRFDVGRVDDTVKNALRDELGIGATDVVLTTTGSLTEEKGHRFMLEGLAQLSGSGQRLVWLVVGDGECGSSLRQRAAALGLDREVRFLGRREDIADILSVTDIFVLPSLIEGLPMALLEAMAAGRACIATRVGDVVEVIEPGVSGLTVGPEDGRALAAAIEELLRDPSLREGLGSRAREVVAERYSSSRMTKSYCAVYDRLLG